MDIDERYYPYSKYLKKRYGEKVYKLPVNLPVTCPNRISGAGCSFCAETGTGFEAMDSAVSVTEQLMSTRKYIENVLLQSEREEPIISWRFQSNHPSHLLADLKSHEYRYHNHIC